MRYILFIKKECPYCVKAQALLDEKEIIYKAVNFSLEQDKILSEIKKAYDWATVPLVFRREGQKIELIGGYTELLKSFENE